MRNAVTFPGTEELAVLPTWSLLSASSHRHPCRVRCLQGQCHRLSTFPLHIPEQQLESRGCREGQRWAPGLREGPVAPLSVHHLSR